VTAKHMLLVYKCIYIFEDRVSNRLSMPFFSTVYGDGIVHGKAFSTHHVSYFDHRPNLCPLSSSMYQTTNSVADTVSSKFMLLYAACSFFNAKSKPYMNCASMLLTADVLLLPVHTR
jgi:hypothetical protein